MNLTVRSAAYRLQKATGAIHLKSDRRSHTHNSYRLDTKVGELLKDTRAVKIFERYVPGVSKNPMIGLAKRISLESPIVAPQAKQAGIAEELVLKVLAEINAKK